MRDTETADEVPSIVVPIIFNKSGGKLRWCEHQVELVDSKVPQNASCHVDVDKYHNWHFGSVEDTSLLRSSITITFWSNRFVFCDIYLAAAA